MVDQQKAKEVKEQYEQQWLALDEVSAIGIGKMDSKTAIIISVTENSEKVRNKIPTQIEGIPIEVRQTGRFKAQ